MKNGQVIVDTDVHNALRSGRDLLPHLPKVWHDQWLEMGIGIAKQYYTPVGVNRKDAAPDSGGKPGSDPEFMKRHLLDPYGIDYAVLCTGIEISLNPDPDYATAVARAYNDWMEEHWLSCDPRYKGSILINSADPQEAAREIDRSAANPNMVQVIMSSASRMLYGQRWFHPIYEAAERNGLPVAIHTGGEGRSTSPPPTNAGYPTRYLEWRCMLPGSYMAHVNSMVFEGVFEKYPQLKFVCVEGGIAWLPHLMWRMDKNWQSLRSSVPWLQRRPSDYVRDNVYLTTQPIEEPDDPEHLLQIFRMIGAEKSVMFSTDYPHWDFDNPLMALPPMPRDLKRRVMGETALEVYRLPHPAGKTAAAAAAAKEEGAQ